MSKPNARAMRFLVYRQDGITPTNFTIITASVNAAVIKTDKELVAELRAGVTKWAKETEDGKGAYEYAGDDMNIGDLANHDLAPILANCPNIYELEFADIEDAQNWVYDTPLCETINTEA